MNKVTILDRNRHESILADHRLDPVTKDLLEVGDRVVQCANCDIVTLVDSWNLANNCPSCGKGKETKNISTIQTIRSNPFTNTPGRKWLYSILLLLLLLCGLGYYITCFHLGYCFKTPITETEIEEFSRNSLRNGINNEVKESPDYSKKDSPAKDTHKHNGEGDKTGVAADPTVQKSGNYPDIKDGKIYPIKPKSQLAMKTWYYDSDGDGFGDPTRALKSTINPGGNYKDKAGDCDDSDFEISPVILEKCDGIDNNCNGIVDEGCEKKVYETYYLDKDGDELGDLNTSNEYEKGKQPASYIDNTLDKCPTRPGNKANDGCPSFNALFLNSSPTIDNSIDASLTGDGLLPSDVVTWSGPPEISFDQKNGQSVSFRTEVVGSYKLRYKVSGSDGFSTSGETLVEIGMTKDQLKQKLKPLIKYGMLGQNSSGNFLASANAAKRDIFRHLTKDNIMVYDEIGLDINPFDTFISADLMGSGGMILDIEVLDISYDMNTYKIDRIELKVLRK